MSLRTITAYFNARGEKCTKTAAFAISDEERVIKVFQNDRIRVEVIALLELQYDYGMPVEHLKPISLRVSNIINTDYEGNPIEPKTVPDPSESRTFRFIDEAVWAYNDALLRAGAGYINNVGELTETGNELAPPDPDVPTVEPDSEASQLMGTW